MTKVELQTVGNKKDERLEYLLQQVKEGVRVFLEAISASKEEEIGISFRAFTLKTNKKEEASAIFDVIMTAVAMEIAEQAKDTITKYTYYHSVDWEVEGEPSLFLHCRKQTPPTREEVEAMIQKEEKPALEPALETA